MCRNIKTLFNFDPPATDLEIHASSLQYVRKICGFKQPSKVNEPAFEQAVSEISKSIRVLLDTLVTVSPARNREVEAAKSKIRAAKRFGTHSGR